MLNPFFLSKKVGIKIYREVGIPHKVGRHSSFKSIA